MPPHAICLIVIVVLSQPDSGCYLCYLDNSFMYSLALVVMIWRFVRRANAHHPSNRMAHQTDYRDTGGGAEGLALICLRELSGGAVTRDGNTNVTIHIRHYHKRQSQRQSRRRAAGTPAWALCTVGSITPPRTQPGDGKLNT